MCVEARKGAREGEGLGRWRGRGESREGGKAGGNEIGKFGRERGREANHTVFQVELDYACGKEVPTSVVITVQVHVVSLKFAIIMRVCMRCRPQSFHVIASSQ